MRSQNSIILNNVESEDRCSYYCSLHETCIFYAYSQAINNLDGLKNYSCVLKSKLDITSGTNLRGKISTKSIKSRYVTY